MPISQKFNVTVAAGVTQDVLVGRAIQDAPPFPATRRIFATMSAADGLVSASVGTDTPLQDSSPNVRATAEINVNMDEIGSFMLKPGDRIRMPAFGGAAGVTYRFLVVDTAR